MTFHAMAEPYEEITVCGKPALFTSIRIKRDTIPDGLYLSLIHILFDAVWSGNSEALTKEMTKLLRMTISYHDYREDFYHAFLAGIFTGAGYVVESNKEHGEGRSDVVVKDIRNGRVAIFEAKYAKTLDALPDACDTAIQQINDRMYAADFRDDYDDILCYGIAFFKKRCMVRKK